MLKLLNPYSILAALAVAGLLFGAGYIKGISAGEKAALRSALTASQEQITKTNSTLTLKREVKHEGQNLNRQQLIDDLCANGWMRDKSYDCSK